MKNLLNTDKYTKKAYNNFNGKTERQWIMYGDNTYEPVRRDQSVRDKYTSPYSPFDWFVTQEPEDWDPVAAGHKVSLNHDYGQEDKPGGPPKARTVAPGVQTMEKRGNHKPAPTLFNSRPSKEGLGERVKTRQTTLGQGPDAYHEYEKRLMAAKDEDGTGANATNPPRSPAQDAANMHEAEKNNGAWIIDDSRENGIIRLLRNISGGIDYVRDVFDIDDPEMPPIDGQTPPRG